MSNDNREQTSHPTPERPRRVSEEAAYWYFLSVDGPNMSNSDRREFLAWLRRSAENIAEIFRIAELHGKLRRFKWALRSLGQIGLSE